jgi:MFS transporter, DHA2 family, multidrug resistance protein
MNAHHTVNDDRAGRKEWIGLAALALPALLLSIDASVIYLAMPRLSVALKANSAQQLWIMDIYGFMIAGFLITMGNLGDRIGYRRLLIIGSAAFGLASAMAAFSPDADMLIAARASMGIAGATIMPSTLALIRNMFVDPAQRGTAISLWMSSFMVGTIAGPLVGGLVLERFWWGAIFLLGVPVMLVLFFAGRTLLPEYRDNKAHRLDITGVILSLAAILPFIYGLTELSRNNFRPPQVLATIAGLIAGILFIRRERTMADPLIDFSLFSDRVFRVTLAAMLFTAVIMGGVVLFVAQYLQLVLGFTPIYAGLWMVPQAVAMIACSLAVPLVARRIRPGYIISTGLAIAGMGMLLLILVTDAKGLAFLITGFVMACIGVCPILVLGTGIVIGSAPPEKGGAAASLSETCNQLGIALGVAILGSIGTFTYRAVIAKHLPPGLPAAIGKAARESIAGAISAASDPGDRHGLPIDPHFSGLPDSQLSLSVLRSAKEAFADGLHMAAAAGVVTFVLLAGFTLNGLRNAGKSN